MKKPSRLLGSAFIMCLCACANPTKTIEKDILRFKREYPNQIQTYQAGSRTMGFAWSGDPSKRPVLFVHGSPGSWEGWSQFLLYPDLQKNFHLMAIDRPGYGSSNQGKTEHSLAKQAQDAIEVLKYNKSGLPAILVGHSFGGPVIARAAIDYPEKIAGLVFVASSVDPNLEKTKWYQLPANWWPVNILIPTELRVCNEEILTLKSELLAMKPYWKNIRAKSIFIQGEKDPLVPKENLKFLSENIDKNFIVSSQLVSDLNHFIPWKRPDLIVNGITEVAHAIK